MMANGLCALNDSEMAMTNEGGSVALFLLFLGIANSVAVIVACPPAGLALLGTSITVFANNMN